MPVCSMPCSAFIASLALATLTGCSGSCEVRSGCSPATSHASRPRAVPLASPPAPDSVTGTLDRGERSPHSQQGESVAGVQVSPAEAVVETGRTVKLTATPLDASGRALTGRPVRWATSNPEIATVSAAGAVTGVAAGFVRITAASEGRSGHAEVTVSAPGAPRVIVSVRGGRPDETHEPAGYRLVSERAFRTKAAGRTDTSGSEGWDAYEHQEEGFSIVPDPTAPKSQPGVGQMRYGAGFRDGSSPAQAYNGLPAGTTRLYLSFWMKLSANWQPHESGINKIFHLWLGSPSQNRVFLSFYGQDPQALRFTVHTQATPDGARNYTQNLGSGRVTRAGVWQRYEVLLVMNTPGVADGEAHAWVDGQPVLAARTLRLVRAGESAVLNDVQWSPTWGGNSGALVRETMYMWLDHAYLSVPSTASTARPH